MWLKDGAPVLTTDGEHIGDVARVVIDPGNKQVTHIVVRRGRLFPADKVVPIDQVETGEAQAVRLNVEGAAAQDLPDFRETEFITLDPPDLENEDWSAAYAAPVYWYPSVGATPTFGRGFQGVLPPLESDAAIQPVTQENIPEGSVALKEGAEVLSADGQVVGQVKRVLLSDAPVQATHLVIEKGWLLPSARLVPAHWIQEIQSKSVQLNVPARILQKLPHFQD